MSSRLEKQTTEDATISNRAKLEVLEEHTNKIASMLEGVTNNIVELCVAIESNTQDNQRVMETIRRETNTTLERLERRLVEACPRSPRPRDNAYVEGLETSVTKSVHVALRNHMRRGGRVEHPQGFVERWIPNEFYKPEAEYGPPPMYNRCS